jgi:hypothetical protein
MQPNEPTCSTRLLRQDLVNYQQGVAAESGELLVDAPAVVGFGEAGDPFGGGGEQHPVAGLAGPHCQADSQMRLMPISYLGLRDHRP